ncbi:hypothetical protein EDB92DRAFT_523605 [Lactarius akahatsu]|uniref:Uncharacterized protein n=1 Tax=Lactarius akahatsu TaxID=416441 RepID=A0AAD4LIX9_9AGAM|nr:hypothetical protein EDB92DRAFT_523605 [Lactarius akahatsu]
MGSHPVSSQYSHIFRNYHGGSSFVIGLSSPYPTSGDSTWTNQNRRTAIPPLLITAEYLLRYLVGDIKSSTNYNDLTGCLHSGISAHWFSRPTLSIRGRTIVQDFNTNKPFPNRQRRSARINGGARVRARARRGDNNEPEVRCRMSCSNVFQVDGFAFIFQNGTPAAPMCVIALGLGLIDISETGCAFSFFVGQLLRLRLLDGHTLCGDTHDTHRQFRFPVPCQQNDRTLIIV